MKGHSCSLSFVITFITSMFATLVCLHQWSSKLASCSWRILALAHIVCWTHPQVASMLKSVNRQFLPSSGPSPFSFPENCTTELKILDPVQSTIPAPAKIPRTKLCFLSTHPTAALRTPRLWIFTGLLVFDLLLDLKLSYARRCLNYPG